MPHLKLSVFGPPRLARDGRPIELNLRKALALLVYLAVSGRSHSRDALATLLWPDSAQREARARLRHTLHRLTQAIGDDILESGLEVIRLHPSADLWLDCAAFRQHVTAGLPAPTDPQAPERLAHLEAAIELYADDFLAGFTLPDSASFDEWEFFQRESLRQLYGQVLEQLVQAYRGQQAWHEAIAYARRWLALDGLHEPAHRALMRLYAWAGQPAAAVRQYQECVRVLDAELGATPEDETTALFEAIRTRQLAAPEPAQHQPFAPRQVAAELEAIRDGRAAEGRLPEQREQAHADQAPVPIADTPSATGHAVAQPITGVGSTAPVALRDASPSVAVEDPLFVAREQELARLSALIDATLAEQSQVAFVIGEAGQGKTALLQAFARRAMQAHPDLVVAGGNCNAYTGAGDPYLPFREILELLTGDVEARALAGRLRRDHAERLWHSLPAASQALLDLGPDLLDTFISARRLLSRAATSVAPGAAWLTELQALAERKAATPINPQQQDLFEQYAKVVQALARRAPLLLILDDLQWADPGSTNLLLHLGRRLQGCRVLIVGAYRPADVAIGRDGQRHPLEHVVGELQRDFGDIRLDLSRAEGRAFVDALLDAEPNLIGESFRETLYQQTLGHPLFTIELLRDVQERGALARDDAGRWVVAPSLDWSSLPARVEGVIGERVGRLDAQLRELLQVASVEGEEFTAEVIARVLGADEHVVVRRLSRELNQMHQLVQALAIRRAGALRLSRYRFRHILIQRYLYHSLDAVERAYQHEAVGQALEVLYGAQVIEIAAQLAWHFEVAQLPEKAAVYRDQAGDQARRSAALDAAIRYYQAALEQWPALDRAGRAGLLRKLGECQWVAGQLQDALATFEACQSLCESLGDREGAGATQRLIGRIYWEQGNREQSLQHYHRALALLEQGPESVELARAISAISQMHMLASEFGQAIAWGERALTLADRLGAEDVMVHALNNVGVAYSWTGDPKRGEALLRESLRRALDLSLPHDTCRAYGNLGAVLSRLGRYAESRATFEELQVYATRVHAPLFAGSALIDLTEVDWFTGRWKEALSRRQQILEWIGRNQLIGYRDVLASTLFGWMQNDLGQAHAAHQILEQTLPKARNQAEQQTTGPHLAQVARARILLGMESDAADIVRELLELLSQTPDRAPVFHPENVVPLIFLCRWLAGRPTPGALDDARAILLALERADAQIGSPETQAALSEVRGVFALSAGAPDRAIEPFRRAVDGWQALGRPYDQARTLTDLGRVLMPAGDAGGARAAFDQALSLIESLAAQLDTAELKAAFLNSPLVQELRSARSAVL